jgi:hypothetical protein
MKQLFKQAFDKGVLTEAEGNFDLWWATTGKSLSGAERSALLLEVLKRATA